MKVNTRLNTDMQIQSMAKTALSIKLDEAERDDLKRIAGQRGKSVTAVIVDGIKAEAEVTRLHDEIDMMKAEFEKRLNSVQAEMQARFEAATGVKKRVVLQRRVSIRLSESEHQILKEQAYQQNLSKAELARRVLIAQMPSLHGYEMPALEVVKDVQ